MISESLLHDLRVAVEYAARAGLLRSDEIATVLKDAEDAARESKPLDTKSLIATTNLVAQLISPVTLADLEQGRNPFSKDNQKRASRLQVLLATFSLLVLISIGYFMQSLRIEQTALSDLAEVQDLRPVAKLTSVRKMAQYDEPLSRPSALYDEYHDRIEELQQINNRLVATYRNATEAAAIPLLPIPQMLETFIVNLEDQTNYAQIPVTEGQDDGSSAPGAGDPSLDPATQAKSPEICAEDSDGEIRLPKGYSTFPHWMRKVLADSLSDFCFQLKVLSPSGQGILLNQSSMAYLPFLPTIKEKVALRTTWFLPFLYGLLGALVFMMRMTAGVRTAAMNGFTILVRLSLGGVAGIVVGWFSATPATTITSASALSIPFALAFLTGYGIDSLFSVLDRLNRALGEIPRSDNH